MRIVQWLRGRLTWGYVSWFGAIASLLGARSLAAAAAFLCNVVVARQLGAEGYGRFHMLFTIMTLVAGFTGPALDTCLVRFAARHIQPEGDTSLPYFKFMLYVKAAVLVLTMMVGFAAAHAILALFLTETSAGYIPDHAVVLAFFGGAAVSLWGFAQSYFQSHQRFHLYAGFEFASSSLRLGLVCGLILFGSLNFTIYLLAYVAAPVAMIFLSWTLLPRAIFLARTSWHVGAELFHFGKWVFVASLFTTATQRLDLLFLNYAPFAIDKASIGRYSAAISVVLLGELVLLTMYSVLLPKVSQIKSPSELRGFIGRFRLPSLVFPAALLLLIPFSGLIMRITFGGEFRGADAYFNVLMTGVAVALACAPAIVVLYSLGNSRLFAGFEAVRFVLTAVVCAWAVPRYGALGAAWTMAGIRAIICAATYLAAHQQVRRLSMAELKAGNA